MKGIRIYKSFRVPRLKSWCLKWLFNRYRSENLLRQTLAEKNQQNNAFLFVTTFKVHIQRFLSLSISHIFFLKKEYFNDKPELSDLP